MTFFMFSAEMSPETKNRFDQARVISVGTFGQFRDGRHPVPAAFHGNDAVLVSVFVKAVAL